MHVVNQHTIPQPLLVLLKLKVSCATRSELPRVKDVEQLDMNVPIGNLKNHAPSASILHDQVDLLSMKVSLRTSKANLGQKSLLL